MRMEEADEQECPPSRLKTLCEEYGPIKDHLSEKRKVRKESAKVSSPAVMIRRKDTPPATPTTPVRRSLLLGFARSSEATTSFNEADEVGYAKNEEKKATVQSVLYSPGSIPQIAVQVVEQPLGRANIVDNVDIAPKSSYDASISADASLISADQQRTAVSMEQTPLADTKSEASENGKRMANDQIKIVSEPVKWEQGFSSAVIRQMSRSNKWIPVEEEDEQVRLRREEFHSRSHAPSLRDEKGREKPHVHKVSSISSGSLDVKRKANVMSDDARSKSPALVNMHRVGGAYSRSLSFNGMSSLPQQTPALIPQLSRNKRPASLHLNEHATSDSKPHSPTVTPAWSPAHSYVPPTSPRRPMKDRNPPLSPRHHYVPMLHHNFSRPTSPSIVIRPSRSRTFELFSQFAERPARIDGLNTKRHSLPLFTREASEEDRDRSNKRTSIGVTSPISGVATLTSPSLVGEQARTFPRVNRHPYVPRIERLHREDDKQTSLTPTFRPQNEDTLTASSFSLPLQQNVGYSRSVTESDLNAGRLKNSGSLVETASGSERFISGSSYANSELSKSTPNVAQILSPPPSRSSFHQPIYDSLPSYLSKSALSPSPFAETIKSSAKSTVKNSQGGAISALSSNNPLSPSRTEKRGANSTAEAVDFFEPTDRVESIQRPPEFSLPLTREPVLSLTAELQSSPVSTKSSLPGGSLGDYYRIFQPTAYRSPDQDFIRHEVKVVQEHSPVEHRSSKPVPVAVASSASQKFLRHKVTSLPVPTSPLQQSSEVPSSPLNRRLVYKEFAALQPAKVTRTTSQGSYSNPEQQDRSALSSSVNEKLLHEEARTTPLSPPLGHNLLVGKSPVKSSASYKISVVEPLSPLSTQVNADSVSQSTVRRSTISGPPSNAQLDEKENVERFGPIKERFKNATLFFEEKAAEIQRANRSLKPKPITYKFTPFKSPTSSVRYSPIAQSPSFANGSFALMPAVNVSPPAQVVNNVLLEKFDAEDSPGCAQWNPKLLIDKLYEIDYSPRKESKRNRFTNMEGHLDVPVDDKNIIAELQKSWTQKYFRTRDGRLQWFASHFADDYPVGEILLSGCEVDANKEEGTLSICGGRDRVKVIVRVPLTSNLFDKWRKAITSHSASSYLDSFVHPVYPQLPHINEKVAIIELGSCSIRAGVLTMEPSLPQSFFPAIVLVKANGETMVGADALSPENRHSGELIRPIHSSDPTLERYSINKVALKACFQKCITDLRIDPRRYRVLLSIPQNIPTVLIADILKIVLQELRFLGAAISRQPSLILYSYDVTTGVVVDIGDRLNIVPVIDGYVLDSATVSLPYGALQITNALQAKLAETNNGLYTFRSPVERLILRYIMEQACYVSTSFEEDVKKCRDRLENVDLIVSLDEFQPTSEMLSTFKIDSARFTAPEGLFKPNRWGLDIKALHQLIHEAIQLAPIDSRKTLLRNIYLAGGASLLPGLAERLELEISALVAPTIHTQVHLSPWRYNAAYLGAQIIASSTQFDTTCVTLDNLNEFINQLQCSTF
uniref:PH domain-containing protein n=2 Tax=Parascaris univalens TaxID=6257 RepID=A0A915BTQ9_PARUN